MSLEILMAQSYEILIRPFFESHAIVFEFVYFILILYDQSSFTLKFTFFSKHFKLKQLCIKS